MISMEKTDKLIIFGAGRQGEKLIETVETAGIELLGFISTEKPGTPVGGFSVLGDMDWYLRNESMETIPFHVAIGDNYFRKKIFEAVARRRGQMVSIISPGSDVSPRAAIGAGSYIGKLTVIQNHVTTGICCLIDTGSIIEHGTSLGDFVTVSPGAVVCGDVTLQQGVAVGAGATIIEKTVVGENSLIGAGSVVIDDVDTGVVVAGNPAKIIRRRNPEETYLK